MNLFINYMNKILFFEISGHGNFGRNYRECLTVVMQWGKAVNLSTKIQQQLTLSKRFTTRIWYTTPYVTRLCLNAVFIKIKIFYFTFTRLVISYGEEPARNIMFTLKIKATFSHFKFFSGSCVSNSEGHFTRASYIHGELRCDGAVLRCQCPEGRHWKPHWLGVCKRHRCWLQRTCKLRC